MLRSYFSAALKKLTVQKMEIEGTRYMKENGRIFFLFCLFRCPTSYERKQNHDTTTREIMHIASLEAHTTLNTYHLWKLALRGHLNELGAF